MCTSPINRYKVSVPFDKLLLFGGMEDKKTINALGNNGIYIALIQKAGLMKMRFREIECFQFP